MLLRQGGFVRAVKGQHGGYLLAKSADKIRISDVLDILGNSILADAVEIEADTGISRISETIGRISAGACENLKKELPLIISCNRSCDEGENSILRFRAWFFR